MPAVRYVALAALVVWLGGTMAALDGELMRHLAPLSYACGAVTLIGLFVMKFVGPPPRAFVVRSALVAVMLIVTTLAFTRHLPSLFPITLVLGFILLAWYARE
jgi:hypothetical protein